jgi:hypothetical protein
VVPRSEDVESYGASMPPNVVEIFDSIIPSTFANTGEEIHPHMECDQPTPTTRVVDCFHSHDLLDTDLPPNEAILEVMASIDKPKEDEHHRESIIPDLEQMRVSMMSLYLILGSFARASSRPLSLDPFSPWLYFSKLTFESSTFPSL